MRRITGEVARKRCVIVDDMISTGSTIVETVHALNDAGASPGHAVAATHAVLVPGAIEKMASAGVRELFVTDTIAQDRAVVAELQPHVVSIAPPPSRSRSAASSTADRCASWRDNRLLLAEHACGIRACGSQCRDQ